MKFSDNECLGVFMELDKDFSEFVALFIDHDVQFLIVGGYALAAHGLPRATGDLDAWVRASEGNAVKVFEALKAFGFGDVGVSVADFDREDSVVQLGFPPYRIDILTSVDGVEFEEAWNRRILVEVDNLSVPFISRDDLIANKKAAGRPQDIADVQRLTQSIWGAQRHRKRFRGICGQCGPQRGAEWAIRRAMGSI